MITKELDGVKVSYDEKIECVTDDELMEYIKVGRSEHGRISAMTVKAVKGADDDVDVEWKLAVVPFDRIRRITGYLVGTLDRFNNAKRAEVSDRVKHG